MEAGTRIWASFRTFAKSRLQLHRQRMKCIDAISSPARCAPSGAQGPAAAEPCQGLILQHWMMQESRGPNAKSAPVESLQNPLANSNKHHNKIHTISLEAGWI
ncbi:hypothetical protein EK904_004849 [Melospiza melodia maxima]|nr:hypothetical protein EK904_004849 [Melospiza melodia maxima]